MSAGQAIAPFFTLFLSFALLITGSGLMGTLLGLRMTIEWFPIGVIGLVTAAYSLGFIVAARLCPWIISRVGHIRSFAAFCALAASSTLSLPMFVEPALWGVMRALFGFSMAGLFMVVESWLNDRTAPERRGQILGIYSVVSYVGYGGGQFLLVTGDPAGFELFSLAAILLAMALVPVTLLRSTSPEIIEVPSVRLQALYRASPLGLVSSAAAGVVVGAFLMMAPVAARGLEFSATQIALLMGMTVVGGFILQWPIGRLSDRYNRRLVIAAVALVTALCSAGMVAGTVFGGPLAVIAVAVVWGGFATTLYPLAVAITTDFVEPRQILGTSAKLLLLYGVGMAAGPVAASGLMRLLGPTGLFWTVGAAALMLSAYALLRQYVGPTLDVAAAGSYRMMPRDAVFASALDPRGEPEQLELDLFGEREPAAASEGWDSGG